jgi:hypothetical protein
MTHSNRAEKAADRWAGEQLWNVSLLPVPSTRRDGVTEPASRISVVLQLPLDALEPAAARRPSQRAA